MNKKRIRYIQTDQDPQIQQYLEKANDIPKKLQEIKENVDFKPIRMMVVAPSGRGKSTYVSDYVIFLIKTKCVSPSRIIIYSQTYKSKEDAQRKLIDYCNSLYPKFEKDNCREDIDEDELTMLYNNQKFIAEETNQHLHQYLVIYDDQITSDVLTKKRNKLKQIQTMGRRYNISQIMLLQSYRGAVDSLIRKNVSHMVIGLLSSQDEIEDVLRQYSGGLADDKKSAFRIIQNMYNMCVDDGYGFIIIHCDRIPGKNKFQWSKDKPDKYLDDDYLQ